MRRRIVSAIVTVLLTVSTAVPVSFSATARDERRRIGLLIVDHGEPPEYNELTYWSFREFFDHLIEMGLIPSWVRSIDNGTVVQDRDCYACEPADTPHYIDAWLGSHDGPAMFVPASESTPAHHVVPGGPGLGEPDIFEHVGLGAWHEWELMGGRSPNYDQKLVKKKRLIEWVRSRHGGRVPVSVAYGIDPRINGTRRGLRRGVVELINRERVDHIVVAYHGVGFSDIMQTHMIRHEIHELVQSVDESVSLSYTQPIGTDERFVDSVVAQARRELASVAADEKVAIHLSGHGLPTGMCGEYDCGSDAYHRSSGDLFRRTKRAMESRLEHEGGLEIFHIYGDGGEGDDDPDDLVDSPMEALAERKRAGFDRVIDIPYEFDSDSRDTLIILRQGYRRPIPDWDPNYESRFVYEGMDVWITNSSFGDAAKTEAFIRVVAAGLRRALR